MSGMVVEQAKQFDRVELCRPDHLVIFIKPEYAFAKSSCERPEHVTRFQQALAELTGREVRVEFRVHEAPGETATAAPVSRPVSPYQRLTEVAQHPMIRRASELFGAQPIRVDEPPKP
jgi:hypothetical protein